MIDSKDCCEKGLIFSCANEHLITKNIFYSKGKLGTFFNISFTSKLTIVDISELNFQCKTLSEREDFNVTSTLNISLTVKLGYNDHGHNGHNPSEDQNIVTFLVPNET